MNQGHNIYKTKNAIRKCEEEQCMKHTSWSSSKRSLHKEQSGPSLRAKLFLAFDKNSCLQYYLEREYVNGRLKKLRYPKEFVILCEETINPIDEI